MSSYLLVAVYDRLAKGLEDTNSWGFVEIRGDSWNIFYRDWDNVKGYMATRVG
jgi:hypothetical protein